MSRLFYLLPSCLTIRLLLLSSSFSFLFICSICTVGLATFPQGIGIYVLICLSATARNTTEKGNDEASCALGVKTFLAQLFPPQASESLCQGKLQAAMQEII